MHAFVAAFVVFAAAHACGEHSFAPEKNTKKKSSEPQTLFSLLFSHFFPLALQFF